MRIYTSLIVLSVFTLSLSGTSEITDHSSTLLGHFVHSGHQVSSVQTGEAGPTRPSRGAQRRDFFQAGVTIAPSICHRGSGRREFSWA